MRTLPKQPYNGITIVLSNPSRFDTHKLLTGAAGFYVSECLTKSGFSSHEYSDVRTSDTRGEGLLSGTRGVLLLGEGSLHSWQPSYKDYSLHEQRGYVLENYNGLPCMCSYSPQDTMDAFKDWESELNEEYANKNNSGDEFENDAEDYDDTKKRKGKTKRANYRFWFGKDLQKFCRVVNLGINHSAEPNYILYPNSEDAIKFINTPKNKFMEFDIETDSNLQCTVFSCSFEDDVNVLTIPCIRYNSTLAYSSGQLSKIFRALAVAFRDNTVVCHNSMFDLFVLAWKYRLPFGRKHYDTMLAFNRCFPEAEKSLGHGLSWCSFDPYHKDDGVFNPHNQEQEMELWKYNAKDVWGTKQLRKAINEYASRDTGLQDSIEQVCSCIYSYLLNTLHGIRYDAGLNSSIRAENDWYCNQLLNRVLPLLTGAKKNQPELLPTSPKSCVKYFHGRLGLQTVGRTGTGNSSLDEKNILKLKLKYPQNAALDVVLAYRQKMKETGALKFQPWIL